MAERLGFNEVIQFSNNSESIPSVIPTNTIDLSVVSRSVSVSSKNESINTRVFDFDGVEEKIRIANFIEEAKIRLYGDYPQNFVDLPKYDLSNIIVINDSEVSFSFILSLRNNDTDSNPQLYTTSEFYNSLLDNYSNKNPIPVNDVVNEKNIISLNIEPLKQKIEDLRTLELSQDINLTNSGEKKYVEVIRNLFANSNYKVENGMLKAEPSYDLIYLLRYISWVVSKPTQNYNDRLLSVSQLAEINEYTTTPPSPAEPSVVVNTTTTNPPQATTQTNLYPPIGRAGYQDEEESFYNDKLYIWDELVGEWIEDRGNDSDGQFR
jgi:hypothetical protein